MAVYYIDTSALLKRYRTERGTETVTELFEQRLSEDLLITSYFTVVEVEAAAARALRGRLLTRRAYWALLGRFGEDIGETIVLQGISSTTLSFAAELAREHALRAGDAIQLATALSVRRATATSPLFVASDRELLGVAEKEGFARLNPEEEGALGQLQDYRSRQP